MTVLGEGAIAHLAAVFHVVDNVAHRHGHAIGHVFHHDVFDVVYILHHAFSADEMTLMVALDIGATRVDIILLQCLEDLGDAHASGIEPVGRESNLILLDASAHGVHLYHPGDHRQLAAHGPVLDGAQLLGRVECGVGLQTVEIDFAQSGGDGSHLGTAHSFGNLLTDGA